MVDIVGFGAKFRKIDTFATVGTAPHLSEIEIKFFAMKSVIVF